MEIEETCSSTCLSSKFLEENEKNYIVRITEKLDLRSKKLYRYYNNDDTTQSFIKEMTPDEIFDKFEVELTKKQIKYLFKNNE